MNMTPRIISVRHIRGYGMQNTTEDLSPVGQHINIDKKSVLINAEFILESSLKFCLVLSEVSSFG